MYTPKDHAIFEARLNQILVIRSTIELHLKRHSNLNYDTSNFDGIILVAGNIYTDARNSKIPKEFTLHNKTAEEWLKAQEGDTVSEYDFLVHVLSGMGKNTVVDFVKESHGGEHPVTFGDSEMKTIRKELINGEEKKPEFSIKNKFMQLKSFFGGKKAQKPPTDTFDRANTPVNTIEVIEELAEMPKEDVLTELHD